jgi:outer membrane protein OmpA-like peptidoglycan-associated protein
MNEGLRKMSQPGEFVDRDTMRFVRDYPHPTERVWAALIDAKQISVWWLDCKILEPRAGGRYEFDSGGGTTIKGRITEFQAPRLIEFSGATRFELSECEAGCRLVLTLKRWPIGWNPVSLAGFHGWLERLGLHLGGVTKEQANQLDFEELWLSLFPVYEMLIKRNVTGGAKVIHRVHFQSNASTLDDEAKTQLAELIEVLRKRPDLKVALDGFGDDPCSVQESEALSRHRIEAVSQYLQDSGVHADRIMLNFAVGNHHFLNSRATESERACNRRVDARPIY